MTRNILITGATKGIGRTTALYLARRGYRVFATGRDQAALRSLQEEAKGLALETLSLDVTDPESIDSARDYVSRATDGYGVDVLINNAGYGHIGPIEDVSDADLRKQMDTNVFGLMNVTRAFLPAMKARGSGRVLNVSSIGGRITTPFMGAYHASKYAVEALSNAMRIELAVFGVDIVLIEPGYVKTHFANTSLGIAKQYSGTDYDSLIGQADKIWARFDAFGADPIVIARLMERAITARRPNARYVAPLHGKLALFLVGWLPTFVVDAALRAAVGINRRNLAVAARSTPDPHLASSRA